MKQLSYEQALSHAASLCSGSEHCSSEMHDKLQKWGLTASEADRAIDYLLDEKYIDDARFCRAYANDKFRYSHWGRIKIRQMLRLMHLPDRLITEGLSVIDADEYKQAVHEALLQKNRTLHEDDSYKRKAKLMRHLLSRGYEMEYVYDAIDSL